MFPKKNKLSRKDFSGNSFAGNKIHTPLFTLIFTKNAQSLLNLGIIVSKKISKKAVIRNKIKRQFYGVLNNLVSKNLPYRILLIAKPQIFSTNKVEIKRNLENAFSKLN